MYCSVGNTVGALAVVDVGRPISGFISVSAVLAQPVGLSSTCLAAGTGQT